MSHTSTPSLGHVHLQVSDLERSIAFYRDVVGLEIQQRDAQSAFMSFGGYHHHLGLNTWRSKGAGPAPRCHPGLFHSAFVYPDRAALGQAIIRVLDAGLTLEGAADHGVSEAVYLSDPDGNGVELYRDRAQADWPREAQGTLRMFSDPLDVQALIAEGEKGLDA
ncbi:VOC family protein [Litoreibacter janthinus]|uniref:Catechol 2,3-dioxygenase n=1 Tax=Litoreibacter janthinus TaxID=670154 RepID=A0A1I6GFT2_9RHOB|nr:VOC family protein [Litoreibacter janthinus]SFR41039.1 catechol 2,3-dioxygenase [Litoreibacter janthinus]